MTVTIRFDARMNPPGRPRSGAARGTSTVPTSLRNILSNKEAQSETLVLRLREHDNLRFCQKQDPQSLVAMWTTTGKRVAYSGPKN